MQARHFLQKEQSVHFLMLFDLKLHEIQSYRKGKKNGGFHFENINNRRMSEIEKYLASSSPLSRLANKKGKPLKEIKNSVDEQLKMMAAKKKNYVENPNEASFADMKASAIIYNVPEFSPPEINFEVAQKLKEKINNIKQQIVTKLPSIRSSNYNTNKVDSFVSHRTVVKELQEWLRVKLQNPPTTVQDSIEYKNMIMGVGMKEVIRLIGTRCTQEANTVNEIWELTWGICREIIIYLSKRAKKCETILQEQIDFLRKFYDHKLIENQQIIKKLKQENEVYQARSDKLAKQLSNLKKKNKNMKFNLISIEDMNNTLKEEFEHILKENLTFHLNGGSGNHDDANKKKTDWVRRMYANLVCKNNAKSTQFRKFMIKIMKENNYILDTEDFGDFELKNDLNQYRTEEQMRRSRIEMQLHQNFKKIAAEAQTDDVQCAEIGLCTERIQTLNCGLTTDTAELDQVGINTLETNLPPKKKKVLNIKNSPANNKKLRTDKNFNKLGQKKKGVQFDHGLISQEDEVELSMNKKISTSINIVRESIHVQTEGGFQDQYYRSGSCYTAAGVYVTSIGASHKYIDQPDTEKQMQSRKHLISMHNKSFYSAKSKNKESLPDAQINDLEENDNDGHLLTNSQTLNKTPAEQQEKIEKLRRDIIQIQQNYENRLDYNKKLLAQKNALISKLAQQLQQKQDDIKRIQEELKNARNEQNSLDGQEMFDDKENLMRYHYGKKNGQLSLQASRKNILNTPKNHNKANSEHKSSQLALMEALQNREERINSIISESPTHKTSKPFTIADYFGDSERPKTEVCIGDDIMHFHHVCYEFLDKKLESLQNNKTVFTRLPDCNVEAYKEILKQVMEERFEGKQKQMRSTVDKTLHTILKQISKDIQHAMKTNRLTELKAHFSNLPTILISRFNRNFGVKKVAQKHLKDFLFCLKGIQNYTKRYSVIWYFIRNTENSLQNSELLLFYILTTNLFGSIDKTLTHEEAQSVRNMAEEHLSSDSGFISKIACQEQNEEIQLTQLFKIIIVSYHQLCENKAQSMKFIYQTLTWTDKTIPIELFLKFIATFPTDQSWYQNILREMANILQYEKDYENGLTKTLFMKIVKKCSNFNLEYLSNLIQQYGKPHTQYVEYQESQLMEIGRSSELCSNFVVSILNQRKKEQLFTENQIKFMHGYLRMHQIQEEAKKMLGSLTFFEGRSVSLYLGERKDK